MLKSLALLIFVILPIDGHQDRPQSAGNQYTASDHAAPPPIASNEAQCTVKQNGATVECKWGEAEPKSYFSRLRSPENAPNIALFVVGIIGIIVAICTLRKLERQTTATEKAAEAALAQANHIVASERAWMIASIEEEVIPNSEGLRMVRFSIRCRNNGKTPAFLLSMKNNGVVLPREQALPEVRLPWNAHNVEEWPGDGIPIQPEHWLLRHNYSTVAPDLQKLLHGSDWLWVYGEVIYLFGNRHETRYCFLWDGVHDVAGVGKGTHFLAKGPASYIRAT